MLWVICTAFMWSLIRFAPVCISLIFSFPQCIVSAGCKTAEATPWLLS